jgi:hypothetical protein
MADRPAATLLHLGPGLGNLDDIGRCCTPGESPDAMPGLGQRAQDIAPDIAAPSGDEYGLGSIK